jgi:hypothetical protein
MAYVGARMSAGAFAGVEERLRDAERRLDAGNRGDQGREVATAPMVVDEVAFADYPG